MKSASDGSVLGFTTVKDGRTVLLRSAAKTDLRGLLGLLKELKLPVADVDNWWPHFTVANSHGVIVGIAGIEAHGAVALLRSVAVSPEWQGCGLGEILVTAALETAAQLRAEDVFLLTMGAETYFPRLGFTVIARDLVPREIQECVEFREACPASAIVMHRPARLPNLTPTPTSARKTR